MQMEQNSPKKFYKSLDEKSRVFTADKVVRKEKLGQGKIAPVYVSEVWKDGVEYLFAVKDYDDEKKALTAFNGYLHAKAAGLAVFPTVRISEDHKQLLMTLGTNEKFFIVGEGSEYKWKKAEAVLNILDVIMKVENDVLKATTKGLGIPSDSQFFLIKKSDPNNATYYLGDYDFLEHQNRFNLFSKKGLFIFNLEEAQNAVVDFASMYLEAEKVQEYRNLISDKFKDFEEKNKEKFMGIKHRLKKYNNPRGGEERGY